MGGSFTMIEDFESYDLGSQGATQAGSFTVVEGISPGSTRAAQINSAFRHILPWSGAGQTVTTFSFDMYNPTSGNAFTEARVFFALNQNSGSISTGANNLIRAVAITAPEEAGGVFELHQTGGSEFVDDTYPLNTFLTVHFVLNNTSEDAMNDDGVMVPANSVQLWHEIDGDFALAGSAVLTADRFDADLTHLGIGTFGAYDRDPGVIIDSLRFADGIAVIPEPSTYAGFAGLLALGLVIFRRRLLRKG